MEFLSVLEMAHRLVGERLAVGDVAVDATAGNGNDTVFLSRIVGVLGRVYAFDIQGEALRVTKEKLDGEGLRNRAILLEADHAEMGKRLRREDAGRVGAVMFNLGYLPGGDKSVVTRPGSTLAAVEVALGLIRPGGVVTVVVYTGHAGGGAEGEALEKRISAGLPEGISGFRHTPLGRSAAPYLLAFTRSESRST